MIKYFFDGNEFEYETEIDWVKILRKCDKETLIDFIIQCSDYGSLEEYFEEEIKDTFEDSAYKEYLECVESYRELEHLYFEFMSNR